MNWIFAAKTIQGRKLYEELRYVSYFLIHHQLSNLGNLKTVQLAQWVFVITLQPSLNLEFQYPNRKTPKYKDILNKKLCLTLYLNDEKTMQNFWLAMIFCEGWKISVLDIFKMPSNEKFQRQSRFNIKSFLAIKSKPKLSS